MIRALHIHGLYMISAGVLIGACMESFYTISESLIWMVFLIGFLFLIYGLLKKKQTYILVMLFFFSFAVILFRFHDEKDFFIKEHEVYHDGQNAHFEGVISNDPDIRDNTTHLVVNDGTYELLVTIPHTDEFAYGDKVSVAGKIESPESFETSSGKVFDYVGYLAKDRIFHTVSYGQVELIEHGKGNIFIAGLYKIKHKVMFPIRTLFKEDTGSLLSGILFGDKKGINQDITNEFITTGTIHIVALSGYNVTIVALALIALFRSVFGYSGGMVAGAVGIVVFAVMTGLGATVLRASVMAILAIVARMSGSKFDAGRALLFAATCMILINPWILIYDISFQLSCMATCGLVYFSPLVYEYMGIITTRFGLREIVSSTIATNIAVLPLLMYKTGIVSIVSVPVNVLVVPVVPVVMLLGALTITTFFILTPLALFVAYVTSLFLVYILKIVHFTAHLPFASFSSTSFSLDGMIVLYVFIFVMYVWLKEKPQPGEVEVFLG